MDEPWQVRSCPGLSPPPSSCLLSALPLSHLLIWRWILAPQPRLADSGRWMGLSRLRGARTPAGDAGGAWLLSASHQSWPRSQMLELPGPPPGPPHRAPSVLQWTQEGFKC